MPLPQYVANLPICEGLDNMSNPLIHIKQQKNGSIFLNSNYDFKKCVFCVNFFQWEYPVQHKLMLLPPWLSQLCEQSSYSWIVSQVKKQIPVETICQEES